MSLLNSDFIHARAGQVVAALHEDLQQAGVTAEQIKADRKLFVEGVIHRVLGRTASETEIREGSELIDEFIARYDLPPARAESLYALSVLNWNEFVFVF